MYLCICMYACRQACISVCNIHTGSQARPVSSSNNNIAATSTSLLYTQFPHRSRAAPRRAMLLTRRQCEMRECHIKIHTNTQRHTGTQPYAHKRMRQQLQRERTSEYSRTVKNKVRVVAERERDGGGGGWLSSACMYVCML